VLALCGCEHKLPAELAALELSDAPPGLPLRLGVELGGAIELVGASIDPASGVTPGAPVKVTLYWRKHAEVERGFRLFTHVLDEAGERLLNLDSLGALRKTDGAAAVFPPSAWRDGKVYVDRFVFTVPEGARTDSVTLVCGLFRDSERLPITRGGQHGDRVRVARIPLRRAASPVRSPPAMWVPVLRPDQKVLIDGKLDEPAWEHAGSTGALVNVATGEPMSLHEVSGNVKLLYDDRALYVGFEVFDDDVRGGFDPHEVDPHLWLRDTTEMIIDPDGDGDNRDYYEIQIGPQNLVFDSEFDAYNLPHVEPNGPFGHQEWSAELKSAVEVRGTLDDAREDDGYVVELSLPWSSLRRATRVPPRPGDNWRMNFYAMQDGSGAAWSPILGQGNFHKASRFGRVFFAAPVPAPAVGRAPKR